LKNVKLPEEYDDSNPEQGINSAACTIECQDFAVHFSCFGQNRIQLIGVK
jgi:hypothetical protein